MSVRVTVIIPAFNSEGTIGESLESIRRQTRKADEIIVVDDASTDSTCRVVETSGIECRLIRLEQNAGPAASRNRGIAAASGDWIAFLDADDRWLPDRLAIQCLAMETKPDVALWCGNVIDFSESGVRPEAVSTPARATSGSLLPLGAFVSGNPIATSTVLVNTMALRSVQGFDEQFRGPEDYDLWIRLAAKYPLMKLDHTFSMYRQRPGSLSQNDQTFLPQVLRVISKAFGEGGAMSGMGRLHDTALSNQYWNASWMAFNRGARLTAIRYLARAYCLNRLATQRVNRKWGPLLFRYVMGRRQEQSDIN